jgi:hypothetical protein
MCVNAIGTIQVISLASPNSHAGRSAIIEYAGTPQVVGCLSEGESRAWPADSRSGLRDEAFMGNRVEYVRYADARGRFESKA